MNKDFEKLSAVKGMKDILPGESRLWQFVEGKTRLIFERFNYREMRTPFCERTELFKRSIGDTTDIVEKEMFTFTDKGGDSLTLRPEGTASVVRASIENNMLSEGHLSKLYYIGPMFRYEKPQKGRQRQFHQIGAEALGIDSPLIDSELIILCKALLEELSIKDFSIQINSLGCEKCRPGFKKELVSYLNKIENSLCKNCLERKEKNPLRVFDCKNEAAQGTLSGAPLILDHLCQDCKTHLETLKRNLAANRVDFKINPMIVRGLDYYTRTVFEFTSSALGAQNSILGGGRYNSLVKELGGPDTPASGFAMGMERIIMILEGIKPVLSDTVDLYIASIGDAAREFASQIAMQLREKGINTEAEYSPKGLKWQMGKADKLNASFTLIIGEDEIKSGRFIIRDMKTKQQTETCKATLIEQIKSLLSEGTENKNG